MGREFELKYAASPAAQQAIEEAFGRFSLYEMRTDYYDTPDRELSRRHITLRRRRENEGWVCTLKTPGDGSFRGEWELEESDIRQAAPRLAAMAGVESLIPTADSLERICGARFTRRAKLLELPDCTVELALDRGVLLGGGREAPLCEVEVELKSGSGESCAAWAGQIAGRFGLTAEKRSKFARARALAERESAAPPGAGLDTAPPFSYNQN